MIACQRLYRRRREISVTNPATSPEQTFQRELSRVSLKRQGLEYKYRSGQRLNNKRDMTGEGRLRKKIIKDKEEKT